MPFILLLAVVGTLFGVVAAQEPNQPARITGRVVAADTGHPLRGAVVQLTGGQSQTSPVSTDLDGRFVLAERRIGRYSLQVTKPGYVPSVFGRLAGTIEAFEVTAGQQIDRGTIRLKVAAAISGRVQDESGDPVADAGVVAWRLEFPEPGIRVWRQVKDTTTNDLGEFRLHSLMPGRYHVAASRVPYIPQPAGRPPDALILASASGVASGPPHQSDTIVVETTQGGETSGASLTLGRTGYARVSGSMINSSGRPGEPATVRLRPVQADDIPARPGATVFPDGSGRFVFHNVPFGEYRLSATARPLRTAKVPVPAVEEVSIAITVREDISGIVVQTQPTPVPSTATGRVFVDGTASPARLQMMGPAIYGGTGTLPGSDAPDLEIPPSMVATKPDGQLFFSLSTGWYAIRSAGSSPLALKSVTASGVDVTDGFDVSRVAAVFEVQLTSVISTVTGVVKNADDSIASRSDVVIYSADPGSWLLPFSRRAVLLRADDKGAFTVTGLPAGQYLAAAPADLDRAMWADPDRLERWRRIALPLSVSDGEVTTIVVKRN